MECPKTFRAVNTYNAWKILNHYHTKKIELSPSQCATLSRFFDIISSDPLTGFHSKLADKVLENGKFGVAGLL
jgi:hypothetical protein